MKFRFEVFVEVERVQGKFASRDEVEDTIREMLEQANEGTVDGVGADGDTEYEINDWSVEVSPIPKKKAG